MAIPKAGAEPLPELTEFLAPFAALFRRTQSRQSVERYITGLLTDLPRKNCATIAAAVAGTSTERLQHLLTDADWDAEALDRARVAEMVKRSPAGGVLVFDDSGLPKQGKRSVGVARQYLGTPGKVGNCQVVVSAEYLADDLTAAAPMHWPVTAELYLPEAWVNDPGRRERAHVPEGRPSRTKPAIALALVDRARAWGVPFGVVVADAGYGDTPDFLAGLEERQVAYVCAVDRDFGVRLPDEARRAAAEAVALAAAARAAGGRSCRDRRRCTGSTRWSPACRRRPGARCAGARARKVTSPSSSWRSGPIAPPAARRRAGRGAASSTRG